MFEAVLRFMASSGILAPKGCYSALIARASCALAALLSCLDVLAQPSSLPREDFWVPDGEVRAVIETNGVVYVGGIFDYVSPVSETGSAFDFESGATLPDFPKITGAVKAVVTDNAGGWFIGGLFTSVGGISITNLAHIRSDRTVDTTWIANPDGGVLALVSAPGMLYVGGSFFHIGGAPHSLLAALDPPTGLALPFWRGDITSNLSSKPTVNALALAGGTLYAGGYFGSINGQPREHVGSMDAATGATTTWYPNGYTGAEAGARIDALAISGKVLYVGGNFKGIGGLDSSGVKNVLCGYLAA